MAVNILLKRSATASKRPVGASMAFGELNLNYDAATGGLYYKDSAGNVVKVGPCQVSATAPNSSPAGSAGNSAGEFWYDSSTNTLKVYNGTSWVEAGGAVDSVTGTAPITVDNSDPLNPVIGVDAASTSAPGVVQLNNTTSSTSESEALTAAQGKSLQDQIDALVITSNLTFAGTLDTVTGNLLTVSSAAAAAGFVVGDPLPAADSSNEDFFVIVEVESASYTPPGGSAVETHVGDWFLSDGSAWQFLNVGFHPPYASTTTPGVVQLATDAEVQAGVETTHAVTSSGLQSKVSDSVSTTSSTTLASSTAVKEAYDAGIQGQTDAAAAQSTADQAVLDAASAQSTADQAILDAAAAQAAADGAVPDASFTAAGDLLVGTGAGTYSALAAGPADYILSSDGAGSLQWVQQSEGDVTSVSGSAPITVDNTDPQNPVIGIDAATTSAAGAVQLYAGVDSTSDTEAATASAVKVAYDAAVAAAASGNISGIASGTVIFVNTTSGNDATGQRGTTKAFKTITAALAVAQNSDTMFLSPGTFTENVTLTKGINLVGTYNEQGMAEGTSILGNFVFDMVSPAATSNPTLNHIRFVSPNATNAFKVLNNSFQSGGIATINDCAFVQAGDTSTTEFCFETAGTWSRSMYVRRATFDGNVKHAAGTAAGASGYIVLDNTLATGSGTRHYSVVSGTAEFRRPSNALSPVLQTGGVALFVDCVSGISSSNATTSPIFGGTGIAYKGTAASVGAGTVYFNGYAAIGGIVSIGANLVYGWSQLNVTPANLQINGAAVAYTTAVPAAAATVTASQQRPRYDLLTATSSVAAANQLATVVDSANGTVYTVNALDAGTF
jgi:hypothetical protein